MAKLLILVLASCASYSPDLGSEPFACGSSAPLCPDGYDCINNVCTNGGGSGSGSGSGTTTCSMRFTGVLASWVMTGQTGSEVSVGAMTNAPGITASALSRAAPLTAASGTGSINSTGWPSTAVLDATKYYSVALTPPSGCKLAVMSLATDVLSSATGPMNASVATSSDNFVASAIVPTTVTGTPALVVASTGMLEFRIFGFNASATTGTMRVQNTLAITGALQ
jgi:hypothetical protein